MRVLRVWSVLYRLRLKKRSVITVVKFLCCLGESARIKVNVSRCLERVKQIQREARAYQQRRRAIIQEYTKQWIRVEEKHLQVAYKEVAKKLADDEKQRRAREAKQRGGVKRSSDTYIEFKPNPAGWKNYRMDADRRYLALSRELTRRNRNFVRSCSSWVMATREVLKSQVELARFMKSFGADTAQTSQEELGEVVSYPDTPQHDWSYMSDEDMLAFIMYSGGGIQHPAQKTTDDASPFSRAAGAPAGKKKANGGKWPPVSGDKAAQARQLTAMAVTVNPLDQLINSPRLTFEEDAAVEEDKNTHPALEEATASAWRAAGP
jgi:hypothetical protein